MQKKLAVLSPFSERKEGRKGKEYYRQNNDKKSLEIELRNLGVNCCIHVVQTNCLSRMHAYSGIHYTF